MLSPSKLLLAVAVAVASACLVASATAAPPLTFAAQFQSGSTEFIDALGNPTFQAGQVLTAGASSLVAEPGMLGLVAIALLAPARSRGAA